MDKARLASQLKQAEGVRNEAYRDSLGLWTAGVGHLLDQSRDWTGVVFTSDQVDAWLDADLDTAIHFAEQLLEWPQLDTAARQEAVVELVFNMGLSHWKQFAHCRMAITKKDWQTAHDQLLDSLWAKQVGAARSTRLANNLLTGEFDGTA